MPESKVRVLGQGWTVASWNGQKLAYLQTITDTAPRPVGTVTVVQAIDDETPKEIVTPRAVGAGTLGLRFYELWNRAVWQALPGFGGADTLLDVFKRQVQLGNISIRKTIKVPNGNYRTTNYLGCMITDIDESETVEIGTMTLPKAITVMYTRRSVV